MGVAITLKFITTVALYLQLLTLVYLYSGNRARFFRYLVWAWGLFVVSKGSYVIQHFFPQAGGVIPLLNAAGSAGDLLILAAGLAYRGDYRRGLSHSFVPRRCGRSLCCPIVSAKFAGGNGHRDAAVAASCRR